MTIDFNDLEAQLEDALSDAPQESPKEEKPVNLATKEEVHDRALKVVINDLDLCRSMRQVFEDTWVECYRIYRNDPAVTKYKGRANLAVPEAFRVVETLDARIAQTLFSSDRWFRVSPRTNEDKERSEDVESILRWETSRRYFQREFGDFKKQSAIFGTSFAKVFWDFRSPQRFRKARDPLTGKSRREAYTDSKEAGPCFKTCFLEDIYVPTNQVSNIQDQPFVIERSVAGPDEINAMEHAGIYANVDKINFKSAQQSTEDHDSQMRRARREALGFNFGNEEDQFDSVHRAELLERWGEFDLNDDGEMVQCVIVVANRQTVLRIERNPFDHQRKPFVHNRYIPIPGEFYGLGVIEPILSLCYELNDTRNQAMDFKTFGLNPPIIAGAGAGINEATMISAPGRIWSATNINQIKYLEIPTAAGNLAFQMESLIRTNIQDATGASSLLSGTDPGRIEKATVFTGLVEEANVRLRRVVEGLQMEAITPTLQMYWALEQQYRDEEITVRLLGKEGGNFQLKALNPDDMLGDYDFMPIGSLQMGAAFTRHQGIANFLQLIGSMPPGTVPPEVMLKGMKKYWDDALGYYDADDIFPDTPFIEHGSPDQENAALLAGENVPVHPQENHGEHIPKHFEAYTFASQRGTNTVAILAHLQAHQAFTQPAQLPGGPGPQQQGSVFDQQPAGGSAMAGGQGDPQAKMTAEQPFRGAR